MWISLTFRDQAKRRRKEPSVKDHRMLSPVLTSQRLEPVPQLRNILTSANSTLLTHDTVAHMPSSQRNGTDSRTKPQMQHRDDTRHDVDATPVRRSSMTSWTQLIDRPFAKCHIPENHTTCEHQFIRQHSRIKSEQISLPEHYFRNR